MTKELHDRDIKKAMSDSFKEGTLKIKRIEYDEFGNEIEVEEDEHDNFCEICKKQIDYVLDAYSYHMINDDDMVSVEEKLFCCKRCWNKYILREAEKISFL